MSKKCAIAGTGKHHGQTYAAARTAVMYVFSGSDPEYEENLLFFVREGIQVCQQPSILNP